MKPLLWLPLLALTACASTPKPASVGACHVDTRSETMSVAFVGCPVLRTLGTISRATSINIVAPSDLHGVVTVQLTTDDPLELVTAIVHAAKAKAIKIGPNLLRLETAERLPVIEPQSALRVQLVTLDHLDAARLVPAVKARMRAGETVETDVRTNTLILRAYPGTLKDLEAWLAVRDRP